MLCLEDTYFSMAEKMTTGQNALVICDRGTMDASAFISPQAYPQKHLNLALFSDPGPYMGGPVSNGDWQLRDQ